MYTAKLRLYDDCNNPLPLDVLTLPTLTLSWCDADDRANCTTRPMQPELEEGSNVILLHTIQTQVRDESSAFTARPATTCCVSTSVRRMLRPFTLTSVRRMLRPFTLTSVRRTLRSCLSTPTRRTLRPFTSSPLPSGWCPPPCSSFTRLSL